MLRRLSRVWHEAVSIASKTGDVIVIGASVTGLIITSRVAYAFSSSLAYPVAGRDSIRNPVFWTLGLGTGLGSALFYNSLSAWSIFAPRPSRLYLVSMKSLRS